MFKYSLPWFQLSICTFLELDGDININTSDINPAQGATELPTKIVVPQETVQQACETNRVLAAQSGFSIKGNGGVPAAPDSPLGSGVLYSEGEPVASQTPSAIETSIGKIQPARGIVKDKHGRVRLTAYRTDNAGERIPGNSSSCGKA